MKTFKKSILGLFFAMILAFSLSFSANFIMNTYALDTRIAFSDPSVIEGNEVTVVLKITSIEGGNLGNANLMLKYDPSYLEFISGNNAEGGAGAIRIGAGEDGKQEWAYNLRFKALKAGETNVEVSSDEIYDVDGKAATISKRGSSKVTISAGAGTSTNANLSSLSISEGSLNPEFNADITEYTMNVAEDISNLNISAVAADANSTIEISGNENLVAGENRININVSAADGSTIKTYTIIVTKAGEVGANTDSTSDGNTTADGSLAEITVTGKTINVIEPDASVTIPENMVENSIEVNGVKVKGWTDSADAGQNFVLVYGQNADGEKGFYVYDLKEKTIQRYFFESGASALSRYNTLQNAYRSRMYIIYALALLSIILFIIILYLLFRKKPTVEEDNVEKIDLKDDYFDIDKDINISTEIEDEDISAYGKLEKEIENLDIEEISNIEPKSEVESGENSQAELTIDELDFSDDEEAEEINVDIKEDIEPEKSDLVEVTNSGIEEIVVKEEPVKEESSDKEVADIEPEVFSKEKVEDEVSTDKSDTVSVESSESFDTDEVEESISVSHNDTAVEEIQDLDDFLGESLHKDSPNEVKKEDVDEKNTKKEVIDDLGLDDDFSIVDL